MINLAWSAIKQLFFNLCSLTKYTIRGTSMQLRLRQPTTRQPAVAQLRFKLPDTRRKTAQLVATPTVTTGGAAHGNSNLTQFGGTRRNPTMSIPFITFAHERTIFVPVPTARKWTGHHCEPFDQMEMQPSCKSELGKTKKERACGNN